MVLLFCLCVFAASCATETAGGGQQIQQQGVAQTTAQAGQQSDKAAQPGATTERIPRKHLPKEVGWVNDFADLLNEQQEKQLFDKIAAYEEATSNEIAVVTLETIEPYQDLTTYCKDLGNFWGVGKKDVDNGVLLVVLPKQRQMHILPGLGLRETLTTAECQQIIDEQIAPKFKDQQYFEGIGAGVEAIQAGLKAFKAKAKGNG